MTNALFQSKSLKLSFDGQKLDAELTLPISNHVRGAVLFVHGLGGQKNSDTHLAMLPLLSANRIASLRFDFTGHGKSEGKTDQLTIMQGASQVEIADAALRNWLPECKIVHFGASYGATCLIASDKIGNETAGLVLRAPVSDYPKTRRRQLGKLGMRNWEDKGVNDTLISHGRKTPWTFYTEALTLDLYAKASMCRSPLLLVQGTADKTVPVRDTKYLYNKWLGPADFLQIEHADHSFSKRQHRDIFVGAASSWLAALFDKSAKG